MEQLSAQGHFQQDLAERPTLSRRLAEHVQEERNGERRRTERKQPSNIMHALSRQLAEHVQQASECGEMEMEGSGKNLKDMRVPWRPRGPTPGASARVCNMAVIQMEMEEK